MEGVLDGESFSVGFVFLRGDGFEVYEEVIDAGLGTESGGGCCFCEVFGLVEFGFEVVGG